MWQWIYLEFVYKIEKQKLNMHQMLSIPSLFSWANAQLNIEQHWWNIWGNIAVLRMKIKFMNNLRSRISDSVFIWWQSSTPYNVCHVRLKWKFVYSTKVKPKNVGLKLLRFVYLIHFWSHLSQLEHVSTRFCIRFLLNSYNERVLILLKQNFNTYDLHFMLFNKVSNYYYHYYCIKLSLRFCLRFSVSVGFSVSWIRR